MILCYYVVPAFDMVTLLCVRERSFLNSPAACTEKILRGRVWHYHELEISFGRQEHAVISLLFELFANLTRKIVKSKGDIIIVLYRMVQKDRDSQI